MKRGGHKQRRNTPTPSTQSTPSIHGATCDLESRSPLFTLLLQKWAWGDLSAQGIQEIAKAAHQSGCSTGDIVQLASLGAWGSKPGNIHRDLVRHVANCITAPDPYPVHTKVRQREKDGSYTIVNQEIHILLPHEWLYSLDQNSMMEDIVGLDGVEAFWALQDVEGNPRFRLSDPGFNLKSEQPIPFTFHGDGVPHTEPDSLNVLSMRSMTTTLPISHSQLLISAIPKACIVPETMDRVWKIISWSLVAMLKGRFPALDPDGIPFSPESKEAAMAGLPLVKGSGKRGFIYAITGDFEWFSQEFGFPRAMADNPCPYCKSDMPHNCD